MTTSVEQDACTALARWLTTALPGVEVRDQFPDDDKPLGKPALSVLMVGKAADEWTTPNWTSSKNIHDALPDALGIDTSAIVDTATANATLNTLRAAYVAHLADTAAHVVADTVNVLTAPEIVDLSDLDAGEDLANDLRTQLPAHEAFAGTGAPHPVADILNAPTAAAATDEPSLVALTKNLVDKLGAHFAARSYLWQLGSRVQPIQLDLWAIYQAQREELIRSLEQVVRVGFIEPDGPDVFDDYAPVGLGIAVSLGDDWPDSAAAFDFDAPNRLPGDPQANEWRATYEGIVDVPLLAWGQSARLARASLLFTIDAVAGPTATTSWAAGDPGYTETISG